MAQAGVKLVEKFSQYRLFSETREHEDGIVSNRRSERCGEFVT